MKFSKRRRAVPLRPIWTIMVAAKLYQSRVLATKFHQNRSTLKGRSAGQTHTHRHTQTHRQKNSAENNSPFRFVIGPTDEQADGIAVASTTLAMGALRRAVKMRYRRRTWTVVPIYLRMDRPFHPTSSLPTEDLDPI